MDKNISKVRSKLKSQSQQEKVAHTNGKYSILTAIITGLLSLTGAVIVAIISNNVGKSNAIHEVVSQVNTDASNVNIHINTKDDLINLLNELISNNTEVATENGKLGYSNTELQNENNILKEEKDNLLETNESLRGQLDQFSGLADENKTLKEQIAFLEEENFSLTNEIEELRAVTEIIPTPTPKISTGKKVSIFDLDTFQGHSSWRLPNNASYYTDTYGNEYVTSHCGIHDSKTLEDYYVPTYLLDGRYTICEGQIAWSKHDKNSKHSAWIEFYSGSNLIYTTDIITATDRIISFSFSVEGLETLTIVTNSTINTVNNQIYIIYPYLNLIT